jgi:hypothetical protein
MKTNRYRIDAVMLTGLILCASALAIPASAATAALYTKGIFATPEPTNGGSAGIVSQPGGGIHDGSHFWQADGISGFVRLDPDPLNPTVVSETYAGYGFGGSYGQVRSSGTISTLPAKTGSPKYPIAPRA